jgi:hypothetical protein
MCKGDTPSKIIALVREHFTKTYGFLTPREIYFVIRTSKHDDHYAEVKISNSGFNKDSFTLEQLTFNRDDNDVFHEYLSKAANLVDSYEGVEAFFEGLVRMDMETDGVLFVSNFTKGWW